MIKVSFVIPVYNSEKYLKMCLESILSQTLKEIEIILVDDGSTDQSKKIITEYQAKNKNIIYIYQENRRQGAARNKGLKQAKGEYVIFTDSDDYIDSSMASDLYKYAKLGNYDIVLCDYYIKEENAETIQHCYYKPFQTNENVTIQEYLLSAPSPCNKIFKNNFLKANNFEFIEKIVYEDYASIPTLALFNPKIGYLPKPYIYYVQSTNSTMRNDSYKKKFEDIFPASNYLYNKMCSKNQYKEEMEYIFIYHLLHNAAINFYAYQKYSYIKKISNFMELHYPLWYNNKYLKKNSLKFKIICRLFYKNKIKTIDFIRKLKRSYENKMSRKK